MDTDEGHWEGIMLIRLVAKSRVLKGEAWFGVPRLRGADRLKAELRTLLATNRISMGRNRIHTAGECEH